MIISCFFIKSTVRLLQCFHLYPPLELEGFLLEVRVGLGDFLREDLELEVLELWCLELCFELWCFELCFELWCFELCFELWCFELCFELWCLELCFFPELELGVLGGFCSLGGYSSRGSLASRHLLIPGNTLALRLVLSLLRPLVTMSNWRIAFKCAWVISCVSIPGGFGTLFPITAKVSHWPFGYKHVPAVHIEFGLAMPGANWTIGTAIGGGAASWPAGGCGVAWIATNEIPVTRYNVPPAGMQVCTANARIFPSQTLHCPVLKEPHWGTAFVYWYVERALFAAFAGLPEAVIAGYKWPLWHPIWFPWYIWSLAWFWMPEKKVKLIIFKNINKKGLRIWVVWRDRLLLFRVSSSFVSRANNIKF